MRIRPFRGYRYNPAKVPDLSLVVAPPYDQIDRETEAALDARSPWNFARITLGRPEPGEGGGADRHRCAREALERWIAEAVLVHDPEPALYPYSQTYRVGGETVTRRGFIALGGLYEYEDRVVLPHERTHVTPKVERLRHLEATGADTGLIFTLVSDPTGELLSVAAPPPLPPLASARDLRGELHELWRITDPATVARAQRLMAERRLIIADGHHRYETALEYRRRHPGADVKLMAIFGLEGPGLTILANHRLLRDVEGFDAEGLLDRARSWFEMERFRDFPDAAAEAEALTVALETRRRAGRLAVAVVPGTDGEVALLTLRPEAFDRIPWPPGTSPAWRRLALSVLHEGLLKPGLGLTEEALQQEHRVEYSADAVEAVALVRKGSYQAGFLLPATSPGELEAVVRAGELLPPKSTHFYPKLLDGLIFARLDDWGGAA